MILRISATGFELSEELDKYTRNKLESLDKYIARRDRETTLVEAELSEHMAGKIPVRTCQLRVKFRRYEFVAKEATQHMYASVDVSVAAVGQQLQDHQRQHPGRLRGYTRGLRNRSDEP